MSKQDILDFFSDINHAYNDSTRLVTLNRMLDELIEGAASPWHRVEDELPDLLQFVVACNDERKCVVARYVGYQTDSLTPWRIAYTMYDTDIYDEKECGPVRYWMPIEPPTETERSET